MRLEIDFPESVAAKIRREATSRGMEPKHWVLQFVMRKMNEVGSRVNDVEFEASMREIFDERASAFEALARSEREDAAMAPEELALKYPLRR